MIIKMSQTQGAALELHGTHGTCKSRAIKICRQGFKPGKRGGRVGTGIYFWAYENSRKVAVDLAQNWWSYASANSWFTDPDDNDLSCAVIDVALTVEEDKFLDCSEVTFQEQLYETAATQEISKVKDVASLYSMMLSDLENEIGQPFDVIKVHLPVPNSAYSRDINPKLKIIYSTFCSFVVKGNHSRAIKCRDLITRFEPETVT